MSENGNPPVILIKKVKSHHGHHGGAWKVAYADFVTAMMALFIVLWLLSSSQKVQKAVGGYFKDPRGVGRLMGTNKAGSGQGLEVREEDLGSLKEKIRKAMEKELKEFSGLQDQVEIVVTEEGLRIELLETESGVFFQTGQSKPTDVGNRIIGSLAEQLAKLPNPIVIEGHTDARPFSSDAGYTNWELSVDRANAARRILGSKGVPNERLVQIRGFADQHLRKPNAPEDPSNRRVSIIVKYQSS